MRDLVHINDASGLQLQALLGIDEETAQRVIAARPFTTTAGLRKLLPARVMQRMDGLTLRKLDINAASDDELRTHGGLDADGLRSVVERRPISLLFELAGAPGIDAAAFGRLLSIFRSGEIGYVDKLTGRSIDLAPRVDELLVKLDDIESSQPLGAQARFRTVSRGGVPGGGRYAVYKIPQTESHGQALSALRNSGAVNQVLPSFRDADGARRHIDPSFCVIQFEATADVSAQEKVLARIGLTVEERHRTPGLVTARLPEPTSAAALSEVLAKLNGQALVRFAEPAYLGFDDLEAAAMPVAALADAQAALPWHLALLEAPLAWAVTKGSPDVVIAVIDTGVDEKHPSLAGGLEKPAPDDHWNFEDDANPKPVDASGHGSFIAGLLIGNGLLNVTGICPGCRVLPLRVPLTGSFSAYAKRRDAILYAVQRVRPPRRLIINLSWKTAGDVALIRDAINIAADQGALILASAGNWPERESEPHFPSDYPMVLSIGAVGPDRRRAPYSFFGAELDLAAPGGSGGADAAENLASAASGAGVRVDFGTSFAAPLAAGMAALLWSREPMLDAKAVRARLASLASPVQEAGLGAGIVSARAITFQNQPPAPKPVEASDNLELVNKASLGDLTDKFQLLRLTARLIISRRPFKSLAEIWPTLGLTKGQYDFIIDG